MTVARKRLKPGELAKRLDELSSEANGHYKSIRSGWETTLEYVRLTGQALQQAFELLNRGRWRPWLEKNFNGSRRTADDYRTIYREWDNPKLVAARSEGLKVESIQAVLALLRSRGVRTRRPPTPDEEYGDLSRKQFLRCMAQEAGRMRLEELQVACNSFYPDLWYQFKLAIKDAVIKEYGEEYYEEEDKKIRRWQVERSQQRQKERQFMQDIGRG